MSKLKKKINKPINLPLINESQDIIYASQYIVKDSLELNSYISKPDDILFSNHNSIVIQDDLDELNKPLETTPEPICFPFWNDKSKNISKLLWKPDYLESINSDEPSNHFNDCLNISNPYWSSWKNNLDIENMTNLKSKWNFLESFEPSTIENIKNLSTLKIKLHPNKHQKLLFQKCFQHHRYFYNKTVSKINKDYDDQKKKFQESKTCVLCSKPKELNSFKCKTHKKSRLPWNIPTLLSKMRRFIMDTDEDAKEDPSKAWQLETPYDTRDMAIKEALSAYKSAIANFKNGNIKTFRLGYKSRRDNQQVFCLTSNSIQKVKKDSPKPKKKSKIPVVSNNEWLQIFPRRLGKHKYIRVRKRAIRKLPDVFENSCKILKYGKNYYLLYTFEKPNKKVNSEESLNNIISLDPGVRTFQTGYSPSGVLYKFGDKHSELLNKLHLRLDEFRSRRSKIRIKKKGISKKERFKNKRLKESLKRNCLKIEQRIKDIIFNLHNQTASHISNNFQNVLLPKFSTSEMQKVNTLNGKVKRHMWTFSHFKFQQKLIGLCNYHQRKIYIVEEHYTTKTCGSCGCLREVGGAKVFKCECGYIQDRDIHGARNILIKNLTEKGLI